MTHTRTVLAAAGRRIDEARFPQRNERKVARAIRSVLTTSRPMLIVASAACGADILVLETAHHLGIPTRIVLPFPVRAFRQRSVADCNGNWASRYDALIANRTPDDGSLILLTTKEPATNEEATSAYHAVTEKLIEEVADIVRRDEEAAGGAVLVWDAVRKGENDESGYFLDRARAEAWQILEIPTV